MVAGEEGVEEASVDVVVDDRPWPERHRDDLIVAGIFAAARALYFALGMRMDLVFLGFAPHLPDLDLLRDRLLESTWYQHTQPPLFPLLAGILLKLPFPDGITFQVAYLAMGLGLVLTVRRIATTLGLARWATFVAIGLIVTNPGLVSIEFSASYDQPTILLVALMILWSARYVSSGTTRDLTIATCLGAAIVLTRTVFHPAWFLLLLAGLVLARRPPFPSRRTVAALALPLALIGVFVLKNLVLYDEPGLTTWSGASLTKIAGAAARPEQRKELIADGTVSPLFGRPVFWGYETYEDAMPPCRPTHRDIPVLAEELRPSNNSPNLDYECFLDVYRQQGKDARAYMRKEPMRFVGAQMTGVQMFYEPTLPIVFTRAENRHALASTDSFYRWTLIPQFTLQPVAYSEFGGLRVLAFGGIDLQPTMLALDLAAIAIAVPAVLRLVGQRRRSGGGDRRSAVAMTAAMGLTCLWVSGIGGLLEINENARYRLLIEPYLLLLLAWAAQWAVGQVRTRLAT